MFNSHSSVFVHPTSVQHGEVAIGEFSSLWPGCSLRGDFAPIRIGRFTSVQDGCVLHAAPLAPVTVGNFVTVGHAAVLHGCTVEDLCMIGMNATVLDHAVIGRGTIVAAGAVVKERTKVPPGSFVVGVPAEVRPGRPDQEEVIRLGAVSYAVLAQTYLNGRDTISPEELMRRMEDLKKIAG